jgi:spore coat polysaccharide biosynthesis protein SpsF (cytidylyltransferase family)|tara:strand:- start:2371 stop:3156 length:786 start_codon:yes stop_codon:yes gene_type:complete
LVKLNSDIFIPARLNSKRFPKKHLKKINGESLIKLLVKRLEKSKKIRHVIVCTTNQESDDELISFLENEGILTFRGSEKDILDRFLEAAKYFKTDIIVDVEGDKIYTDVEYVNRIVDELENSNYEFITGSTSEEKFDPSAAIHGFVPAGMKISALKKIYELKKTNNTDTGYKEFFTSNKILKKKFITINEIKIPKNSRFTIDYPEDYEVAKNIFKILGNNFHIKDVIDLIKKQPKLLKNLESIIKKWEMNYERNITNIKLD